MGLKHRCQVWRSRWRTWRRRRRATRPAFDREAAEIAAIENHIIRLEAAARIGSIDAAGRLADIAADRVGQARRQLAEDALYRLRSDAPAMRRLST